MDKLRACPFCGGEKLLMGQGDGACGYSALCFQCGVRQPDCSRTQAEAIAAWNRRAPAPADALVERVAEAVHNALQAGLPVRIRWDASADQGRIRQVARAAIGAIGRTGDEAAARLSEQAAEIERLRAALREIAGYSEVNGMTRRKMRAIARAALGSDDNG